MALVVPIGSKHSIQDRGATIAVVVPANRVAVLS